MQIRLFDSLIVYNVAMFIFSGVAMMDKLPVTGSALLSIRSLFSEITSAFTAMSIMGAMMFKHDLEKWGRI